MTSRLAAFAFFSASCLCAEVKLPALISDHMVLQQNQPARVWGTADPGETITVALPGQQYHVKAGASGKWHADLMPLKAGKPFDMTISGTNRIVVKDVLAGEVWVGSGQSNMTFGMGTVANSEREIAEASYPLIRLFTVAREVADSPRDDVKGSWQLCTPESVKTFSAVAYFFGREIQKTQRVPVGLIHSSWGGTPAQSWTEISAMKNDPALANILTDWRQTLADYPAKMQAYERKLPQWSDAVAEAKKNGAPPPARLNPPAGPGNQNTPAGLYNAMIAPLTPYAIRGAIWYQGEGNARPAQAEQYRRLFESMIEGWREAWGEGDFPFYFVQLANFHANPSWPVLRESQTKTLELRNTGMAVAIDVGNPSNIHPTNKQDVGHRLALVARANTYGEKIVYSGPMFRQMTTEGSDARLWFDSVGAGLEARGGKLTGFEIAGPDKKFVPAEARIEKDTVVVSAPGVSEPAAARYAWADDPQVSLYNRDGLPASPFRTAP